jgi:hypothetical protein
MSVLQNGLLGSSRGKVGGIVTGSDVKGQTTARAYQGNVANPRTPAQLKSRVIIAGASKLTGSFLAATGGKTFKNVPNNYPNARSYMVATMRKNTAGTVTATNGIGFANTDQVPETSAFDTMPIAWAFGQLTNGNVQCGTYTSTIDTEISFELAWTPEAQGGYDSATDKLTLLVVDTVTGLTVIEETAFARSTAVQNITITLPTAMQGNYIVVSAFFRKEVGTNKYANTSAGFTILTGELLNNVNLDVRNLTGNVEIFG